MRFCALRELFSSKAPNKETVPAVALRPLADRRIQREVSLRFRILRAVFSFKNGKEIFSLDTLLSQAERRERLLLVRRFESLTTIVIYHIVVMQHNELYN